LAPTWLMPVLFWVPDSGNQTFLQWNGNGFIGIIFDGHGGAKPAERVSPAPVRSMVTS
jgi:hypothetical protein